jgi:hypothetical protein
MESQFGADFGSVRVHRGEDASASARELHARAYTVGDNVVFGQGRYAPETTAGRHLLAHELTHVVQQRAGVHLDRGIGDTGDPYERQADRVADEVVRGGTVGARLAHPLHGTSQAGTALQLQSESVEEVVDGEQELVGSSSQAAEEPAGVPPEVLAHLKLREGWREVVYLDTRHLPTVGLGHLLTAGEKLQYKVGDRVPIAILEAWADEDALVAYSAAKAHAATIGVTDERLVNALTYVNFQLGRGWKSKHKKTWAYLVAHEWEKAAMEAQDSQWYEQTPVRVRDFQAALRSLTGSPAPVPLNVPAPTDLRESSLGQPISRGMVDATSLNVRQGPGAQFEKTGKALTKGAAVVIYREIDGWQCIGTNQWVSGQFVTSDKKQAKAAATLRQVDAYLESIAENVWDAMFGGISVGTDEDKVYANLAKLNRNRVLIGRFEDVYLARFGSSVIADLRLEFSDNLAGNELTRALAYLAVPVAAVSKQSPAPVVSGKVLGNRPARPSDPASQMASLLAAAKTSAKPAGYCYRAIKHAITRAKGYGDILNIYNDARFAKYQQAAVDFAAAVSAVGAESLGLQEVGGSPVNAAAGTLLVIRGNGKQRLSEEYGDISVIEGVQNHLLVCYNDGIMKLPADPAVWQSGRYAGVLIGMYQPISRAAT